MVTFTVGKRWTLARGNLVLFREGLFGFNNPRQTDVKALAIITPALLGLDFSAEAAARNAGGPPGYKLKAVMAVTPVRDAAGSYPMKSERRPTRRRSQPPAAAMTSLNS